MCSQARSYSAILNTNLNVLANYLEIYWKGTIDLVFKNTTCICFSLSVASVDLRELKIYESFPAKAHV